LVAGEVGRLKLRIAGRFWTFVLPRLGWVAITLPWQTVYILPTVLDDIGVLKHEAVHCEQIARDGAVRWTLTYLWWCVRFGYWNNPYEVEARERDGRKWN
jgi:hypothetical protein